MAAFAGPNVVKNGLYFMVDPANPRSYAGSGTVYTDTSGISNQVGTLTNGVTYSSNNLGSLGFNGTNQYVTFGNSFTALDASNMTMIMWINPTAITNNPTMLLDKDNDTNLGYGFWMQSNGKLWFWPNSFQDMKDAGPLSAPTGSWSQVAMTWNFSGKTVGFYYNAKLGSNVTNASATPGGSSATLPLLMGSGRNNTGGFNYKGFIGPTMLYNRVLSQDELFQNFDALRGRYGL